ncbi:ribose-phosphate diphosphokinase [Alteraurantiacibacter aquimixticola]|uniref:Ribose-phosphate diphosphokinase n=1 Tax=Alteraurantiacibacter aquimixticola TaxID=2489173 RepID=A0A4T3F2A9_9SPHN|nr:ribose-phosphate diphosphokinase [Alteraurantiacibacter aquimixticola]TIX50717.1 ribose-phosphate diphosphokinase [Alteraurantiacibacter aquimixticola]
MAAVHAFPECMGPATRLAGELDVECRAVEVHRFPDGESRVQVQPGAGAAILYRSLNDPNAKLVELLLAASTLRENGAERVVLVAPYLGYMRQDIAFEPGQAVSQCVVGKLLAEHFDAVLTVDPHLHRISALSEVMPGCDAVSISAAPALAGFIGTEGDPVLVGPDAESRQWVEGIAGPLGLTVLIGEKRRLGDRKVELGFADLSCVAGRRAVLVDDVISSGRTLEVAAAQLLDAGATSVEALTAHCLASDEDLERLRAAGIGNIRSTDSVAGPTVAIPLAGLLADAIMERGWLEEKA